jgi:hypothetical protein
MKNDLAAAEAASSGFIIITTKTKCFKNLLRYLKPDDQKMHVALQANGCISSIGPNTNLIDGNYSHHHSVTRKRKI